MKRLIVAVSAAAALTSPAAAADLGRMPPNLPAAVQAPAPIYWNGFYIGGQVGYQAGDTGTAEFGTVNGLPTGFDRGFSTNGVVGGAHAGFNYQMGGFVLGLEGDVEGGNVSGSFTLPAAVGVAGIGAAAGNGTSFDSRWQGSIRARAGVAVGPTLLYVTGGAAFAENTYTYFTPAVRENFRSTDTGWTAGAGVEWALTPSWSTRLEYRYTDFGTIRNTSAAAFPGSTFEHNANFHTVRLGLSYRFGGAPGTNR